MFRSRKPRADIADVEKIRPPLALGYPVGVTQHCRRTNQIKRHGGVAQQEIQWDGELLAWHVVVYCSYRYPIFLAVAFANAAQAKHSCICKLMSTSAYIPPEVNTLLAIDTSHVASDRKHQESRLQVILILPMRRHIQPIQKARLGQQKNVGTDRSCDHGSV